MYPLRSIQFLAELVFPPMTWQLADLQRVHATAFKRIDSFARTALTELNIPHFAAQQYAVQSLVTPRNSPSTIDLMARSVLHFDEDDVQHFERAPLLLGVRMTFPTSPVDEGQFHSRIESMQRDPKSIFLENVGVFRQQVNEADAGRLVAQFVQTYDWLHEQLVGYLERIEGRIVP
jgi:hypothetical protein